MEPEKPVPNYRVKLNTKPCPTCGREVNVMGGPWAAHQRACAKERPELAVWTPEEWTLS